MIQERDINNTPTVSYTRGTDLSGSLEGAGGIGGLLGRSSGYTGGNWSTHYFCHADGNGNITYLVDSSQALAASYRYDPYGNTISSSGSQASANVYGFSSKEVHVNSGMYMYLYRLYDPTLQRWLNRDPIERGGINLYDFVGNQPISKLDVSGLAPGDNYGSVVDAGIAALQWINPTSIHENREYAGWDLLQGQWILFVYKATPGYKCRLKSRLVELYMPSRRSRLSYARGYGSGL